jgi:hypothetical protein
MTKTQIIEAQSGMIKELIRICGEKVAEATALFFEIEKHQKVPTITQNEEQAAKKRRGRPRKEKML